MQRALLRADPGNANEYMDMVLELLRQQIVANGLDRVELPDGDLSFSMPFWPFGTSVSLLFFPRCLSFSWISISGCKLIDSPSFHETAESRAAST